MPSPEFPRPTSRETDQTSSIPFARNSASNPGEELAGPLDGPVVRGERLHTLDVLRGFALLGILTINVDDFAGPESLPGVPMGLAKAALVGWHAHLDLVILTFKWMFFEGKMRALFAMLFGAGVVLLTERIERRGRPAWAADIFLRRNMWLVLFGLIHGTLIWGGDILLAYGLTGLLFLFPLRHVSSRRLVGIGLAIWLVTGTLDIANLQQAASTIRNGTRLSVASHAQEAGQALTKEQQTVLAVAAEEKKKEPAAIVQAVQEGRQNYLASIPGRTTTYLASMASAFTSGRFTEVLGAMIMGMGLYKLGFISGLRSMRTYLIVAVAGYAISVPIVLVGIWHVSRLGFTEAATVEWMTLPYCFETAPAMLANASVVLLLVRKGWFTFALDGLGAVGRTAFSNYILTSLICQILFAWSPLKLYGRLEYYQYLYVVVGVWAVNVIVSVLWLEAFAFGPLEWMWRSLTYLKLQPFRLRQRQLA